MIHPPRILAVNHSLNASRTSVTLFSHSFFKCLANLFLVNLIFLLLSFPEHSHVDSPRILFLQIVEFANKASPQGLV